MNVIVLMMNSYLTPFKGRINATNGTKCTNGTVWKFTLKVGVPDPNYI